MSFKTVEMLILRAPMPMGGFEVKRELIDWYDYCPLIPATRDKQLSPVSTFHPAILNDDVISDIMLILRAPMPMGGFEVKRELIDWYDYCPLFQQHETNNFRRFRRFTQPF